MSSLAWNILEAPDGWACLPDLVVERLVRYANLAGRENILAGTDCGLGTHVGHPSICGSSIRPLARAL
jgi:hypothetical protein